MMRIFPSHFFPFLRSGRKYLYSIFTAVLLLLGQSFLNAQTEITPEVRKVLESLAPYYSSGYDRLTPQLVKIGYTPRAETKNWPVLQRLNEAYQTAVDGDKFLALLSQSSAQEYGPIKEEQVIKPYFELPPISPGEVEWNYSRPISPAVDLPLKVKECLTVMGCYLEGGALGGTTGVLKNIFGLSDEVNYELQSKSSSNIEAISRGLQHASKNEVAMKALVGDMAFQLCNNYESANKTAAITEALSWRNNPDQKVANWKSISLDPPKTGGANKGFDIDTLASRVYQDHTKLGFEIVSDIQSYSIKIIISPAFKSKVKTPFFRDLVNELTNISKGDAFPQIYIIENKMRKALDDIIPNVDRSPESILPGHAASTAFWENTPTAMTTPLTKEQVWKSFRQRFPFHMQTIGQSSRQPDGSYFFLVSEPPPHASLESIKAVFKGYNISWEEKENKLGYDGWTKDVIIEVKKASVTEMDTFYHRVYRHLFFIEPYSGPLDLSIQKESIYFSEQTLNYEVRNADLENWLLSDKALGFVPLHQREASAQPLSEVLAKKQTGIWVTKRPILIAWVLPYEANLTGKQAEIREFAENVDFIIGAVRLNDGVAIIAHKRTVPETVLPTMRTETILALATAPGSGLGQSYERNFVLAGRMEKNLDGAPVYLSASLQNTDFGSLLNIADQMLKSWSLNDTVKYINFNHPKPAKWAFPRPLNQVLNSSSITFNGNMEGATQSFELSNQTRYKNLSLLNVSRTGAMAITYMPKDVPLDTVRLYEEKAWQYFANLHSPIWAQTVRYAALFQFFKDFGIKADSSSTFRNQPLDVSPLQNETFRFLMILDSLDEKGISKLASRYVNQAAQIKLIEQLAQVKRSIAKIKQDGGMPALRKWAELIGSPWALRDNQAGAEETDTFQEELGQIKDNLRLLDLLGVSVTKTLESYSQQNTDISGSWIKTPTIVVSYCTDLNASWSGGHNINALSPAVKVGKTPQMVEIQIVFDRIKIVIDQSVFARLTPEVMRRFDMLSRQLANADDFDAIEEEMRSILRDVPMMASRSCESVLPSSR